MALTGYYLPPCSYVSEIKTLFYILPYWTSDVLGGPSDEVGPDPPQWFLPMTMV